VQHRCNQYRRQRFTDHRKTSTANHILSNVGGSATDMLHLVDPDPDYPSDSEEEEGEEEEEEQQQQQPPIG